MCGIAGAVGAIRADDVARCEAMNASLRHRGPDDSGLWTWQVGTAFGAILCHRRLSIIDLRSIAAQPMISPTSGTALVFNGEIYNFLELRRELEAGGVQFLTKGDSEVILKGYDRWGTGMFERLRGMFALVLVDPRARQVVLARDGFGIKPLYWSRFVGSDGQLALAFASEGRALVNSGYAPRRTDSERVGQYLWNGFMPGPRTIWSDVHEVPRGSFAVLDQDNLMPRFLQFWTIGDALRPGPRLDLDAADQAVAASTAVHLTADVRKVVFLSGGVDSTAVAAAAARHGGELHTLSVAFDEDAADERSYAAAAAAAIDSQHHSIELSGQTVLADLSDAIAALDQPSFDGVNSWFVSREAARLGFKVALSGAGGDELAGGYSSFRRAMKLERAMRLPGSALGVRAAGVLTAAFYPHSKARELGRGFGALEHMYQSQYGLFNRATLRRLTIERDAVSPWGLSEDRLAQLAAMIEPLSVLRAVTALESELFLGDRLLRDMDAVSMAHSLEVRVPLVDTTLAGSLAGLPDEMRYLPIGEKQLLRRQSRQVLPDEFFARPKRGFEFPMDTWMRGPLRFLLETTLFDGEQCARLGLRASEVAALWKRYIDRPGAIYWTRPWAIFALLKWAEHNGVTCS